MIRILFVLFAFVLLLLASEKRCLEVEKTWNIDKEVHKFKLEKIEGEEVVDENYQEDDYLWKLNAVYMINGSTIATWSDFLPADCPVDNYMGYMPDSFQHVDLDSNGEEEIVFLYKYYCRGDIAPPFMGLISIENKNIYVIKGRMKNKFSSEKKYYDDGDILKEAADGNISEELVKKLRLIWSQNNYDPEFD